MSGPRYERYKVINTDSPLLRHSLNQKNIKVSRDHEGEDKFPRRGPGNKIRDRRYALTPQTEEIVVDGDVVYIARNGGRFSSFQLELARNNSITLIPLNDSV